MAEDKNKQTVMSPLFGEGEDWEYGQTIDQEAAKEIDKKESVENFILNAGNKNPWISDDSAVFPDGLLIINDVFLYGVPTAAIKIERPTDVFVGETLRTSSPILYSKGRENPSVSLTLLFEPKLESLKQLRRIISVLRRHPFTYLHNNKIAREIGMYNFETNIFALESGTLRTTEDTVGVLVLDLSFRLFNYKPFTHHHWFSGRLFRDNSEKENRPLPKYPPNILDTQGYDADDYVLSVVSEKTRESEAKRAIETTLEGDVPVQLPSESPAWNMYADKLEGLTPEVLSTVPSDYVGFSVREFMYVNPPSQARAGKGNLAYWYNGDNSDLKEHIYPWKVTDEDQPPQTSQERYVDATVDYGPLPNVLDSAALATYKSSSGKSEQIDANTALWLARMVVGEGGTGSREHTAALLWTLLYRWASLPGYRSYSILKSALEFSEPIKFSKQRGGSSVAKGTSEATLDRRARISSMTWEEIPKGIRNNINKFRQGTLPYPDALKSLPGKPTNWAYIYSKAIWARPHNAKIVNKGLYVDLKTTKRGGNRFIRDAGARATVIEILPPKNSNGVLQQPQQTNLNEVQDQVERKREALKVAETPEEKTKAKTEFIQTSIRSREAWIANEANINHRYYYNEDENVRNIFYINKELHVSGDFVAQQNREVAPNLVCSGIAISFGHRLATIKLEGQSAASFQFLGAGNRTGQMIFTYAGSDGQKSANKLNEIFRTARKNAQYFGPIIPEAGSVKISSINSYSNEQNLVLSLLGIENIVVTNVENQTSPDSTDKNDLIVEFIVQDFGKESYEKKFVSSVDIKKRIIRSLMEQVVPRKETGTDRIIFRPKDDIAQYNNGEGRRFKVIGDTPSWFASLVSRVADICTETNEEMPPTAWRRNTQTTKTWEELYREWGAEKLKGRVKNIDIREQNVPATKEPIQTSGLANSANRAAAIALQDFQNKEKYNSIPDHLKNATEEEMYEGTFQFNGEQNTNDQHVDIYRNWLRLMGQLADEAHQYAKDEENFEHYFGSVGKDLLNSVSTTLNECYDDMDLPNVPGTELRLPPEFFIYDDSNEDITVSETTNKENMERLLTEHVNNEIRSITHYMQDAYLGGSYVSKNLPKILENRKAIVKDNFKEATFFSTWWNLFAEGGQAWEPVKYRYDDPQVDRNQFVGNWITKMQDGFGAKSDKDLRIEYMDKLIRLSPYLQEGRHWEGSYEDPASRQALIQSVYGEASDNITFGPNPQYANVDAAMTGQAEPDSSLAKQLKEEEQAAIDGLRKTGKATVELPGGRTVTQDGVVTVGNFEEEKQEEKETEPIIPEGLGSTILGGLLPIVGAIKSVVDTVDTFSNQVERFNASFQNIIALKHPLLNKVRQEESAKNIAKIGTSMALGNKKNDISMRRAYPTFRVYFIEDDSEDTELYGKTVVRAFDDFFSYSAIQEIKIHRSRKIASDTATIRMTNVGRKLLQKRFGKEDKRGLDLSLEKQGIFAETDKEHPFEKLILQNGVKVQIRLGTAANPDDLETVFLGQIVEVAPAEDGKLIEIMIQGYGAELESIQLGPFEDGPEFYSSQQVLSGAIIQDSIVTFGRQSKFNRFNPAEMRQAWTGGTGTGLVASLTPGNLLEQWANKKMDMLLSGHTFKNYPQDDNIYAPPPDVYTSAWERWWNNACTYRPLNQTPWQIFKEHELRHPGYCSLAVPYGHSPRMTMFFGAKSQHYWSRPPTPLELYVTENAYNDMLKIRRATIKDGKTMASINKKFKELEATSPALANAMISDILTASSPNAVNTELGKVFGRYVPFRKFHYFDDEHHIIKNNIRTSVDGTFNEVTVLFFENENSLTDNDNDDIRKNVSELVSEGDGLLSVKLDENIPEEYLRSYKEAFPGCVTEEMARRYASGLLARHLKDMYKGELVILGDASIRPYDFCTIQDKINDMSGPIEVEAVTHIFSSDTGFISIITPDLCVDVNDMFSASVWDVAAAANAMVWGNSIYTNPFAGFNHLGLMAGIKLVSWTQDGEPVVATPLTHGGKPFASTIIAPDKTSMFTQIHGKWRQYWDDLEDAWDKLDIGEELLDTSLGIQSSIFNAIGTGQGGGVERSEEQ